MSETRTFSGSCHCGQVSYRVELDPTKPVLSCNCSMCGRAGTLLAFVPESAFHLERGEDALTDYQFNKHVIHHVFCSRCGIKSFARGTGPKGEKMVAVNVRCLPELELDAVPVNKYDGKRVS